MFDTADDVIYRLTLDPTYTTGTSVGLFIQQGPLPSGHYRFTANSTLTGSRGQRAGRERQRDGRGCLPADVRRGVAGGDDVRGTATTTRWSTATALPLAEDPAGSGYLVGRGLGSIQPSSDVDYWSFEALAGDVVSVSVDTPDSGLNPRCVAVQRGGQPVGVGRLRRRSGRRCVHQPLRDCQQRDVLRAGERDRTGRQHTGSYQLRVDVARGIQLESDANYANDSIAGANVLTMPTVGARRSAVIAGTVMSPEPGNVDEDYFNLGTVRNGETILVSLRLPGSSNLRPAVEIRDSSNRVLEVAVSPIDTAARAHITTTGTYYAVVVAFSGQGPYGQYLMNAAVWPTADLEFPDLAISQMTVPATAQSGETIPVSWTVGNYGTGTTYVASWYDRIVLSANDRYGDFDDRELARVRYEGILNPDDSYVAHADVRLPVGASGNYYIFVETDDNDRMFEYIFEDNNIRQSDSPISVDLDAVRRLGCGERDGARRGSGQRTGHDHLDRDAIKARDHRRRNAGRDRSQWNDRIVFSRNAVFGDEDDRLVAEVPHVGALQAGESYSGKLDRRRAGQPVGRLLRLCRGGRGQRRVRVRQPAAERGPEPPARLSSANGSSSQDAGERHRLGRHVQDPRQGDRSRRA